MTQPDDEEPQYDPDARPLPLDQGEPTTEQEVLARETLWALRRNAHAAKQLELQRAEILKDAVPFFRALGRPVAVLDPTTGEPLVSSVRQSETISVDPEELFVALRSFYAGDEVKARAIVAMTLKDPAVDTKDGGRFHQACADGLVPLEVVAEVARSKKSAAYIGFSKPVR